MNGVQLIRRLFEHMRWSQDRLIEASRPLSNEQLDRRFEIGMGSVWATIVHLYAAERAWINAIDGETTGTLATTDDVPDWDTLDKKWTDVRDRWDRLLAGLSEAHLNALVRKARAMPGAKPERIYETALGDVMMHLCSHSTYTIAQAINMLRHLGVQPLPSAMHIHMAREETVA